MNEKYLIGLDRDGTINKDVGYLGRDKNWRDQIILLDGVAEGIKLLKSDSRFKVIVATNQAGVARGFFDLTRVEEVNREIDKRLRVEGAILDKWYYCPFVTEKYAIEKNIPAGNVWVKNTSMRKPGIGMLEQAAKDLGTRLEDFTDIYYIGDKASDVQTGLNAGGRGILIYNEENEKEYDKVSEIQSSPEYLGRAYAMSNLKRAAELIKIQLTIWGSWEGEK